MNPPPTTTPTNHPPLITQQRPSTLTSLPPSSRMDFRHNEFHFEDYIKSTLNVKLDNHIQLCPDFCHRRQCARGPNCPRRHAKPGALNSVSAAATSMRDANRRTVCKHWLRGLCKKAEQCDYLHEYDMRRIAECRFYATFGFCNSGDDCLYLHVAGGVKTRECEWYRRGFCAKGARCEKKHVRRVACAWYLAGFCPLGASCAWGHVKSRMPSVASTSSSPVLTHRPLSAAEAFGLGGGRGEEYADVAGMRQRTAPGRYGATGATGGSIVQPPPPLPLPLPLSSSSSSSQPQPATLAPTLRRPNATQPTPDTTRGWRKDLSEVLCFKCGEYGHFANMCPNPSVPGNRGGLERGPGGHARQRERARPY